MMRSALDGSRLNRLDGGGGVGVRSLGGRTVQKRANATMVEKPSVKMMKEMPRSPAMKMVVATGSCQLPRACGEAKGHGGHVECALSTPILQHASRYASQALTIAVNSSIGAPRSSQSGLQRCLLIR